MYEESLCASGRGRLQQRTATGRSPSAGRQRIVLEVDGKHHFSENDHPSLRVYADMASADRELRLAGYEVYRFGANELVGEGAESRITDFFEKLIRLHHIRG